MASISVNNQFNYLFFFVQPLRFNPDKCYPKIHDLINACLEYKPELRPKLSEIINVLTEHWDGLKQETPVQLF